MKTVHDEHDNEIKIRCDNCGKDLLDPPGYYTSQRIIVSYGCYYLYAEDDGQYKHYVHVLFTCKLREDRCCDILENQQRKIPNRRYVGWKDITDLIVDPWAWFGLNFDLINNLMNDEEHKITEVESALDGINYKAEKWEPAPLLKWRNLLAATYPFICKNEGWKPKDTQAQIDKREADHDAKRRKREEARYHADCVLAPWEAVKEK